MTTKVKDTPEEIEAIKKALAEAAPTREPNVDAESDDELDATIAKLETARHNRNIAASAKLLENFLPRLVAFIKDGAKIKSAHPKWSLPFTMRADNVLYDAVLARGKASPEDIMADIGQYLPCLLPKDIKTQLVPDPFTWITNNLAKKSIREETGKDKDGNITYSRPTLKDNKDGTYSVAE